MNGRFNLEIKYKNRNVEDYDYEDDSISYKSFLSTSINSTNWELGRNA